jgi:hypothetical protein
MADARMNPVVSILQPPTLPRLIEFWQKIFGKKNCHFNLGIPFCTLRNTSKGTVRDLFRFLLFFVPKTLLLY